MPGNLGETRATVHEAAGNRAGAARPCVEQNGELESLLVAGRRAEARRRLHRVSSVVDAAAIRRDSVHFLEAILADIGDVHHTTRAVEGKAPRIAQPQRPDLTSRSLLAGERIAGGNDVRVTAIDVDTENLAEQRVTILAVSKGVPAAAPVPETDVKHAVRAEQIETAIMICKRLRDGQDELRRRGHSNVRVARPREPLDTRVAGQVCEMDKEESVRRI